MSVRIKIFDPEGPCHTNGPHVNSRSYSWIAASRAAPNRLPADVLSRRLVTHEIFTTSPAKSVTPSNPIHSRGRDYPVSGRAKHPGRQSSTGVSMCRSCSRYRLEMHRASWSDMRYQDKWRPCQVVEPSTPAFRPHLCCPGDRLSTRLIRDVRLLFFHPLSAPCALG